MRSRLSGGGVLYRVSPEWRDAVSEMMRFYFVHFSDAPGYLFGQQVEEESWRSTWERVKAGSREEPATPERSPWSLLYVTQDAPLEVVHAAYRALTKLHHSDVGGDDVTMVEINLAYAKIKAEKDARDG